MEIDINRIWLYRIVPIQNLEYNLRDGLFCKKWAKDDAGYVSIASQEVVNSRDRAVVKCFPGTVVNDYVPFYFSIRTPMLYNIITGYGVPAFPQENIIYLCCKLTELATGEFQWCYTNGNAAKAITRFFNSLDDVSENVDWHSIRTTDFRDENADGDEDRVRKKHAEFLVKGHVPVKYIKHIVVMNDAIADKARSIVEKSAVNIAVHINPKQNFYFL